ncbi:glycosyltransferase family 4 protein [Comamonas jiangduensis]|uniref:glycosyltransferase family 4 protein n=1 Tax=Comamonas jiangduensis TaxID=1194168 RepID=UPI003BF7B5D3
MDSKKMKICLIGTVASSTLNFRKTFIELLVQEGHQVFVFATDYSEKTSAAIAALGAEPISYQLNRGGLNPFADIKSTIQLKNKIKAIAPDIVFSYFAKPVIFGTLAAKLAKVPRIVGMLEGLGYTFTPNPPNHGVAFKKNIIKFIQVQLYRIAFNYLDRLIFLNSDDPHDLIDKYKIKVTDIKILGAIGVNLEKFTYTPPSIDPIRFLFIGRLLAEKGIHEYISAARLVKKKYPDVEFIVLGGLDEENPSGLSLIELEELLQDKLIIYPGHVSNVQEWIKKSSIFVLPSYREGIPCSTQEAMACGRAIITTNTPGCKETVKHGINGHLIPLKNAESLSESMIYFIENKHKISEMGEISLLIAKENFCEKKQSEKLYKLIICQQKTNVSSL